MSRTRRDSANYAEELDAIVQQHRRIKYISGLRKHEGRLWLQVQYYPSQCKDLQEVDKHSRQRYVYGWLEEDGVRLFYWSPSWVELDNVEALHVDALSQRISKRCLDRSEFFGCSNSWTWTDVNNILVDHSGIMADCHLCAENDCSECQAVSESKASNGVTGNSEEAQENVALFQNKSSDSATRHAVEDT